MQKIYPCLWFDQQAEQAAAYYTAVFGGTVDHVARYVDDVHKPQGSVMTVDFTIAGRRFTALNGGPEFSFTPAISFLVDCESPKIVERLWKFLSTDGKVLLPLAEYPFSKYFGWVQDRYGVAWQLRWRPTKTPLRISPMVMFANERLGHAKAAMDEWVSWFENSEILDEIMTGDLLWQGIFNLGGYPFRVIDSEEKRDYDFSPAISFCVECRDQAEIDRLWEKITANGQELECGWAEDAYGVSWQIFPASWNTLVDPSHPERAAAVTKEMYTMKKIDIARLQEIYDQF